MQRKQPDSPLPSTLTPPEQAQLDGVKTRLEELTKLTNCNLGFGPGIASTRGDRVAREEDSHNGRWLNAISSLPDARPLLLLAVEFRAAIEAALDQVGLKVDRTSNQVVPK